VDDEINSESRPHSRSKLGSLQLSATGSVLSSADAKQTYDCQWLQYLHSVGLLQPSFRPAQQVCALRSLLRHRDSLVQMASAYAQRMLKALDQMNLQLHHVISAITGPSGVAILEGILNGESPLKLARLRDYRIKASEETVAKSLVGDYRPEHLFTLRQSLQAWRYHRKLLAAAVTVDE
jgi:transposase